LFDVGNVKFQHLVFPLDANIIEETKLNNLHEIHPTFVEHLGLKDTKRMGNEMVIL
jgi:hypothetical protein